MQLTSTKCLSYEANEAVLILPIGADMIERMLRLGIYSSRISSGTS